MSQPDGNPTADPISAAKRWYRSVRKTISRVYATFLMALILYLTLSAVWYLISSLAKSSTPEQLTNIPVKMDRALLDTERAAWRGFEVSDNPRTPLAHYHRVDGWIQPDKFNGCTQSGCHAPLPHSKRKEVRAFLNMHATSLHCGVCHMQTDKMPLDVLWYDLANGQPQSSPAILEAYGLLLGPPPKPEDEAALKTLQEKLVRLLKDAAAGAGNPPAIQDLAEHFAAVRATSEAFPKLLTAGREALPKHFRGEYGAKLALAGPSAHGPMLMHPNTEQAVKAFLDRRDSATGENRKALLDAVHPLKRPKALHCSDCHTTGQSLIDFAKIGYPASRADALRSPIIVRMIESINAGREMHLPGIVKPDSP